MNWIYVIQNEFGETIAATFSKEIAVIFCRANHKTVYREIPYINSKDITITAIDEPIPPECLR